MKWTDLLQITYWHKLPKVQGFLMQCNNFTRGNGHVFSVCHQRYDEHKKKFEMFYEVMMCSLML